MTRSEVTVSSNSVAQDQLRAFIERLERMHEERKALADDIREIYAEAKGNGFSVPALKTVLKIRATDHAERLEREALVNLYLDALGMAPVGSGAPAPARAREIIDEFDPAPDEIQESGPLAAGACTGVVTPPAEESVTSREAADHALPAPIQESTAAGMDRPRQEKVGDGRGIAAHVDLETVQAGVESRPSIPTPDGGGDTAEPDSGLALENGSEVAPIADVDQGIDRQSPKLQAAGSNPAVGANHADLTDKTGGEKSPPAPAPARVIPAPPGVVTYERCPPNPVHWHDYARCFPEMFGLQLLSLSKDIERNGMQKPIVKIGDAILDGRSRYNVARQLVGEGLIESYPVVEYAGDDPLRDMVRWNLESGRLLTMAERKAIATKLSKLPGNEHRASELAEWFGLEVLGRAA